MKDKKDNVDYKELYFKLFNSITDTIEGLKKVQCEAEEIYINAGMKNSEEINED